MGRSRRTPLGVLKASRRTRISLSTTANRCNQRYRLLAQPWVVVGDACAERVVVVSTETQAHDERGRWFSRRRINNILPVQSGAKRSLWSGAWLSTRY